MRITLEFVDDIPRTANGKYRWVISRVPLGLGSSAHANLFSATAPPSMRETACAYTQG